MISVNNPFTKYNWLQNFFHEKRQFILFIIIGGLNTLFGYTIFALFIFCKLHYTIAVLFSTILGIIFNFFTTGRVVFKNKKNHLFFKFVLIYGILYLINISIITLLNKISNNLYLNGAISIATLSIISFFSSKYYVFKEKE